MSGRRDFVPLDDGGRYTLDRAGVAYRVDDGPPRPLVAMRRAEAAQHARADLTFEKPEVWGSNRQQVEPLVFEVTETSEREATVIVDPDGNLARVLGTFTEWIHVPCRKDRWTELRPGQVLSDAKGWFSGQPVRAVGDTERNWYALELPDRSVQVFHGPSVAAHLFRGIA